jgi:hypothetical protein
MKVTVTCVRFPHLAQWVQVLVDRGWKLIEHGSDCIKAKKHLGQSEYPAKNTTVWQITLEEKQKEVKTEIEVPAFAECAFSRMRMYEEFVEVADEAGEYETEEDLEIDILEQVRGI